MEIITFGEYSWHVMATLLSNLVRGLNRNTENFCHWSLGEYKALALSPCLEKLKCETLVG